MKILITGAGGMLGTDLAGALSPFNDVSGMGLYPADHLKIRYRLGDLTVRGNLELILEGEKPDILFHTAAMTQVDDCELKPELARLHNFEATKNLVDLLQGKRTMLVFFSTDYVFDGSKSSPYLETDAPRPANAYGESKALAENYIQQFASHYLIFRISWLYGRYGNSFPRTMMKLAQTHQKLQVVDDQIGRPTYTKDIAGCFADFLRNRPQAFQEADRNLFHLGNSGTTSWADFARKIFELAGRQVAVESIPSSELKRPAPRPKNSVLSLDKIRERLGVKLREWPAALSDFLKEAPRD